MPHPYRLSYLSLIINVPQFTIPATTQSTLIHSIPLQSIMSMHLREQRVKQPPPFSDNLPTGLRHPPHFQPHPLIPTPILSSNITLPQQYPPIIE